MSSNENRIQSVWISALVGTLLIVLGLLFLRFELTIRSTGVVRAAEETRVYAPADGVIARHHVQVGQDVQRGDLLMELDDTELALRAVQLQRELTETESARDRNDIALREIAVMPASVEMLTADERKGRLARITAIQEQIEKNYESGHDLQIISELELRKQEIDKLRAQIDLVEASQLADWQKAGVPAFEKERLQLELKRLDALHALTQRELELVEAQRAALHITSPLSGRVVALSFRFPGMAVKKGDEVAKVAALDGRFRVLTHVPERNVDLIKVGSGVLMESEVFDSMLEGYIKGTVVRISPEPSSTGADVETEPRGEGRYEMDIAVKETPYPLVLGSRVRVMVTLGKRPLTDVFFRSAHTLRKPAGGRDATR